jgi:ribosome biogenesis GTPase
VLPATGDHEAGEHLTGTERITGKGGLTRYRTVIGVSDGAGDALQREVDESRCVPGRVLRAIGANRCDVEAADGTLFACTVRRVLRTLQRDERNLVVAGDCVQFRPVNGREGVIERVEPRRSVLSRGSRRFAHVIAANIEQLVIVASADEPPLKPALIDRFLVSAEKGGVRPIICINKLDLVDPAVLQPIIGLYARLGYELLLTQARDGVGIDALRRQLIGQETVFAGQSGVGKSSLLNAVQPDLGRRIGEVSSDSGKGRHTTRVSELIRLDGGGWVVDTPGVRQLELWDVPPGEVEAYFREFRPYIPGCRFPDCTHTHEEGCRVKQAVAEGQIAHLRYESYRRMLLGE